MARLIFFFSCILICHQGSSQQVLVNVHYVTRTNHAKSDTIYYQSDRKLTWADFKGKPDVNHFGSAITASGFAYDADMAYDGNKIVMDFYVYTFFLKKDSWKKPYINGSYHLEHEQKHFDITYIGAMNFVNELRHARFTSQNFKNLPSQIFNKANEENTAMQNQYDRETKHSINTEAQLAWNKKIAEMLETAVASNNLQTVD